MSDTRDDPKTPGLVDPLDIVTPLVRSTIAAIARHFPTYTDDQRAVIATAMAFGVARTLANASPQADRALRRICALVAAAGGGDDVNVEIGDLVDDAAGAKRRH